jgi:hypothetical protein
MYLSLTGCPPVATLDPTPVGDADGSRGAISGSTCLVKESPFVYPFALNYLYKGNPLIPGCLGWGINLGTSGVSPYLKLQVIRSRFSLNLRTGIGGGICILPGDLLIMGAHYQGDATCTISLAQASDIYFGVRTFGYGLDASSPYDTTAAEEDTGFIDEERFVQGIWLGGCMGFRLDPITLELGLHQVIDGTDFLREATFDDWSPSIGLSYQLK